MLAERTEKFASFVLPSSLMSRYSSSFPEKQYRTLKNQRPVLLCSVCFAERAGRTSCIFPEEPAEVQRIVKAHCLTDGGNGHVRIPKQVCCLFIPKRGNVLHGGHTGFLLEKLCEVIAAQVQIFRNVGNGKVFRIMRGNVVQSFADVHVSSHTGAFFRKQEKSS